MTMILFFAAISAVTLVLFAYWSGTRKGMERVGWVSMLLLLCSLGLCLPSFVLQFLATLLLAVGTLALNARPTVFRIVSVLVTVGAYGLLLSPGVTELRLVQQLRREYPLESLADRLSYEHAAVSPTDDEKTAAVIPTFSPAVQSRLDRVARKRSSDWRGYMLKSLHDTARDEFVVARGFGNFRMRSIRREFLVPRSHRQLVSPPAAVKLLLAFDPLTGSAETTVAAADRKAVPAFDRLLAMHFSGLDDFVNPERMGYIQDVQHVAGFQSHGYTRSPRIRSEADCSSSTWSIAKLELVSLLRHPHPVAYESEYLPDMDALKEAKTRPLNSFEWDAIETLRTDEDVVFHETGNQIEMVGSLRASNDCLKCHAVNRGDLLGALTYRLVPTETAEDAEPPEEEE